MVAEYFMFVKALARKLSKNRNEELQVTMCWLRTKISFLCRRAASCHSMSEAEGSKTKKKGGEVLELCSRKIKTFASDNDCCRCRYPRRDAQVPPINVIYKINYIHS